MFLRRNCIVRFKIPHLLIGIWVIRSISGQGSEFLDARLVPNADLQWLGKADDSAIIRRLGARPPKSEPQQHEHRQK